MAAQAGYSGTPLARKLGLKDGQSVAFAALPDHLSWLTRERAFSSVERANDWSAICGRELDYVHVFTDQATTVDAAVPKLRELLRPDGMIWFSWPKKASKVPTDVTEDTVRDRALSDVMVDVKVCAVDEVWSGLKLVVRKEHRG